MDLFLSYWKTLWSNCSDPHSYRRVVVSSLWSAGAFFVITVFLTSSISIATWRIRDYPSIRRGIEDQFVLIQTGLPLSTSVSYDGNILTATGSALPITIATHESLIKAGFPSQFLSLGEYETFAPETFLTIGKERFFLKGPLQIHEISPPYRDLLSQEPWVMTASQITQRLQSQLALLDRSQGIIMILLLLGVFLSGVFSMVILLLLLSFVAQSVGWLLGLRLKYLHVFAVGLHAMAIAGLVDELQLLISRYQNPSVLLLAYAGIMLFVFLDFRQRTPQEKGAI